MTENKEKLDAFLSTPLPVHIVTSLMETVEAAGTLRGVLQYSDKSGLLYDALYLYELWHWNALSCHDYSLIDLLVGISSNNSKNNITKQSQIISVCEQYLNEKMERYGIIPATDLIKVSACIKRLSVDRLTDCYFADAYELQSQIINEFLDWIYTTKAEHSWYVKIVACYLFISTDDRISSVDRLGLNLLFTCLINRDPMLPRIPVSLCRYSLLNEPYKKQPRTIEIELEVSNFLLYLKQTYRSAAVLLQRLDRSVEVLGIDIDKKLSGKYSHALLEFLQNKLSFCNRDVIDHMKVSKKTAIGYIRMLEESGFIIGIKNGREKTYINAYLFSCIEKGDLCGS